MLLVCLAGTIGCIAASLDAGASPFFPLFPLVTGELSTLHDEGTERTWFEPEQRPRECVRKRLVYGKQSPQGTSKMS